MKAEDAGNRHRFMTGGGEMGALTREKNWHDTVLGDPATWPHSLKTILAVLLNSRFPMFLWWGPDLICFYNDAYRPSLGQNGKHPVMLGQKAEEAWPEIWGIIKPLIDQVLSGEGSTWSEDQLIPIYRNGQIEDVYWTFSYSPVNDDNGIPGGVLVTCYETTEKVKVLSEMKEREDQLSFALDAAELATWDYDPLGNRFVGNDRLKEWFGLQAEDAIDLSVALNVIVEEDRQRVVTAISRALNYDSGGQYEIEYSIKARANSTPRIVLAKGKALFNDDQVAYRFCGTLQDITERVLTRIAIEKTGLEVEDAEQRLRLALEAANLASWDLDLLSGKLIHSSRMAELFGHDETYVLSHAQLRSQVHPEDRKHIIEPAFQKALETDRYYYEARMLRPDGSLCWIKTQGKVLRDKAGNAQKMIGTMQDITEEVQHRQEILAREEKFRLLADSMPQFVWTSDAEGKLNYFNRSVFDYSGLSLADIEQGGFMQIVHPGDRDENTRAWNEAISTGKDFLLEHRFRRQDGIYRWHMSRAVPQRDLQGNIQMWVGTSTDIDDQKMLASKLEKQVEEKIRELKMSGEELVKKEELYQRMVGEVQDYSILFMSREGIIENWNKGAEKIKGYTTEEIVGKSFSLFYTPEDRADGRPAKLLRQAAETGRAVQEGWRMRKNGDRFWASVVITALHDADNNVIGFTKVTRDLTEKRDVENKIKMHALQLEEKNKELENMNAELKSFAYVSSHDLQEPLRKIQTFASLVIDKEKDQLSERGNDYLRRMQNAAGRMQALIEDLLTYSRANSSERVFNRSDLRALVTEGISDLKDTILAKGAIIDIGAMCMADVIVFQFRQLVQNVVGNALKFAKPGIAPHIRIDASVLEAADAAIPLPDPRRTYCHISFSDNGIGFDPVYKTRIFEVFQRLHGKDEYPGTGIGLAIVKKIVDNHEGVIIASSEQGTGTTFDIYIPLVHIAAE